jgi:hypothetical protein
MRTLDNIMKILRMLYQKKGTLPVTARSKAWVATARLLGLWVRIQPVAWMFISCEGCLLTDRGPCDGPITHPEESYRMRYV